MLKGVSEASKRYEVRPMDEGWGVWDASMRLWEPGPGGAYLMDAEDAEVLAADLNADEETS